MYQFFLLRSVDFFCCLSKKYYFCITKLQTIFMVECDLERHMNSVCYILVTEM